MTRFRRYLPLVLTLLAFPACAAKPAAAALPEKAISRGELLYTTHCIACHTQQAHWRKKKVARNWTRLIAEVGRWQEVGHLDWNAEDIDEVAQHLNARYYHYPPRKQ